jgi:hypothetical protein
MDRDEVKNLLDITKVYFEAFFNVCPYTLGSLKSIQKQEPLIFYRHLGSLWIWLSGETLEQTGKYFNRSHATVLHSIKSVINEKDLHYKPFLDKIIVENKRLLEEDKLLIKEVMGDNFVKKQEYLQNKFN